MNTHSPKLDNTSRLHLLVLLTKYIMLATILIFPSSYSLAASSSVIDSVDIDETSTQIVITLHFTLAMTYSTHFPANSAAQLDIKLQAVARSPEQQQAITQAQSLGYNSDAINPLELIRYEPDNPAGKGLSLLFSRTTSYTVDPQANPESLTIRLAKKATPTTQQEILTPPVTDKEISTEIEDSDNFDYVINLHSSQSDINIDQYLNRKILQPYTIYLTQTSVDNSNWNRIRMGFFRNKDDAQITLKSIKGGFPRAWIDRVKPGEQYRIQAWLDEIARDGHPLALLLQGKKSRKKTSGGMTKSQALFAEAKSHIIIGEYRQAVQKLTKLLNMPDNESTEAGHELLGLAREKNQQIAHAIAEYRIYLKKYPQGEFRNRVSQRLNGLTQARKKKPRTLRKAKAVNKETPWDVYGTVFQFYRRDVDTTDTSDTQSIRSSLDTDISVSSRKRTKKLDIRTQMTGSYQFDLEENDESQFRLSSLYIDASDRNRQWDARFGRQSKNSGGVLGRFDGVALGYRIAPEWKLNAVTGFPVVISSSNQFQTDKSFFGMSVDAGTFKKYWNASAFLIKQSAYDIDDRTAIGAELRYLNPKATIFALVDYDIDYKSLNIAQIIGNIQLPGQTSLNLVADYRNSPALTTSNSLQGQINGTLEELLLTYTEEELRQLAQDRTAVFRSVSGTLSKSLKDDLQISLDLAASHLESTPGSGGVDATPSTGIEYFYGAQLIANNIFKKGDTALFGLRYADTSSSDTLTLSINSRFPYKKNWRFNPRLRIDDQKRSNNAKILKIRPSFRADYRARRNLKVELEIGYDQADIEDNFGSRKESNYFVNIGYILDF